MFSAAVMRVSINSVWLKLCIKDTFHITQIPWYRIFRARQVGIKLPDLTEPSYVLEKKKVTPAPTEITFSQHVKQRIISFNIDVIFCMFTWRVGNFLL